MNVIDSHGPLRAASLIDTVHCRYHNVLESAERRKAARMISTFHADDRGKLIQR
jgi:hypothetical protein